jgi:hypothetical protein
MKETVQQFVQKFGLCVIIASLCSACTTGTPSRQAPVAHDLNYFQPNCKIRDQQIKLLISWINTSDDRLMNGGSRQANWMINHHLNYLRNYC